MRGPYKSQRAAALESFHVLGISLSACKRSDSVAKLPSQSLTSQYRYVYYNKRRRLWFGQHGRSHEFFITKKYSDEEDAAIAVSEYLHRDVGELLHDRRPARRELINRCQIISEVYGQWTNDGPEDWRKTIEHGRTSQRMYMEEPSSEYLSVLLKYGLYKDRLLEAWDWFQALGSRSQILQSMKGLSELDFRTERLWHMLCKVVQASANQLDLFEP